MAHEISKALGALLLGALSLLPRGAAAADACIPAAASAALTDCSAVASLPAMSIDDLRRAASAVAHQPPAPLGSGGKGSARKAAPRPFTAAEATLAGGYHRFLCEQKPPPGDAKAREQRTWVAYARARLHFEANHFAESAAAFRAIAVGSADTASGGWAVQLYLESLNVLGSEGAPACYDDMARDVPTLLGLYCKDGREKANGDLCEILGRIQRDIRRLEVEKVVKDAETKDGLSAIARYEAAGDRYMALWNEHGRAPCEAKQASCQRSEEILYNAARAYQAARAIDKAIAARKVLVDPRYNLHHTEIARRTVYEIGTTYHALAAYEDAALWYERFARESPKLEKAPEALLDACVLRLAFDDVEAAAADAALYAKLYGAGRPADTARAAFAVALHQLDHERWEDARRRFAAAMPMVDKSATVDVQIQAHAGMARALEKLRKDKDAGEEHRRVLSIHRASASRLYGLSADDTASVRALGKALTAVGASLFFFAEEKRRAADAIALPGFRASDQKDVANYIQGALATAVTARRRAVEEAEKAYLEVLSIQPVPPPRWVIASAARVARMYGKLAAEILALSPPRAWKRRDDLRVAWIDALDAAGEPLRVRAKAAYRQCVALSVRYQFFDGHARGCAAWLERHYPAEYPRLDEIIDKPSRVAFGLEERPLPARER